MEIYTNKVMREEKEIITLRSPFPFNEEISLEAFISVVKADDILPKKYILYLNTSEGEEIEKHQVSNFSEAVRIAYRAFGDFLISSWDNYEE